MKLRNCNLKDNWYCEDNIGKDAARGVAAKIPTGNSTGN